MASCRKCGREMGEGRRTGCRDCADQPTLDGYEPDAAHRGIFAALASARMAARETSSVIARIERMKRRHEEE